MRLSLLLLIVASMFAGAVISAESIKHKTVNDYLKQAKQQGKKENNLINESSPYLLQHAYNPVNWYAWGEAAFEKAKKENKPIFLSIGYSTCHWCHVMAHESFENEKISTLLNTHFVAIKVDREQRPDIDAVYMSATQLINGQGGWPMTVFLDHDLRPFHAATYYPPFSTETSLGLDEVLLKITDLWVKQPAEINRVAAAVTMRMTALADDTLDAAVLVDNINNLALQQIIDVYDDDYGGFSAAPKFPRPGIFALLNKLATPIIEIHSGTPAELSQNNKNIQSARKMMRATLDGMASGGIFDQVSGGFHRYSVDDMWQVPHFEKMLYNQALMTIVYSDFYRIEPQQRYKEIVYQTLNFVTQEMRSVNAGYYSALDADSDRVGVPGEQAEGAYYLWHVTELEKNLTAAEFAFIKKYYQLEVNGNIHSDPRNEFTGLNIFYIDEAYKNIALTPPQVECLTSAREKLSKLRRLRPRPALDDKIITAWNGMMLAALARASVTFDDPALLEEALDTISFIKKNLYDAKDKKLYRQYRSNKASTQATLADYAWLIHGLLEVYQAGRDTQWLNWAIALHAKQDELFLDVTSGVYYESSANDTNVLFRSKNIYDGALPSANAIVLSNLRQFSALPDKAVKRDDYSEQADKLVSRFAAAINRDPAAASMLLAVEIKSK